MRGIIEQLRDAFERSKMSVQELLEKSGLDIDRSSLDRKLKGLLRMNIDEAQALAIALDETIAFVPPKIDGITKVEGAA